MSNNTPLSDLYLNDFIQIQSEQPSMYVKSSSLSSLNEFENTYSIKHLHDHNALSYFSFIFSLYQIPYRIENDKIIFSCLSIQSFNQYKVNNYFGYNLTKSKSNMDTDIDILPYKTMIKFIYDLGVLIKSLEKDHKYIFCFSLHDFIIIDNSIFLFINSNKISKIICKSKKNPNCDMIQMNYPLNKNNNFISKNIDLSNLPLKCHYKYSYYNLALIIIYLLTGKHYEKHSEKHYEYKYEKCENNSELLELLENYKGSKLYNFLLRCLNEGCFLYT